VTITNAEAFGAIRRAAAVARGNDEEARRHGEIVSRMLANDPQCKYKDHNPTCDQHRRSQYVYKQRAASVRFAIRSAIKSQWLMHEDGMTRRHP
jgi:hypothetical protein